MKEIIAFVAGILILFTVIGCFVMMFTDAEGAFGISATGLGIIGVLGYMLYSCVCNDK